ncbi:DUF4919 domain-containing protein [Rheinheimera sp. UJ63]|uniref:DUF4919 domain-containing protein n=1 Tax=Rheinheimera sp. UJ63 TaxID=2910157 RepID=UPI001F451383|nr:DUF4919 domain-containing protein [Rheinheimera sp. UJ63]MCF4009742.1 DUF4919 domain-containing protein [Rheinheimera sp. UJ63]
MAITMFMQVCRAARTLWVVLMLQIVGCSQVSTYPLDPLQQQRLAQANLQYKSLIADIEQSPDPARLATLRKHYISTSFYQPHTMTERVLSTAMFDAIKQQQWQDCLLQSDKILKTNYISLNGHYGAMLCHLESQQQPQGEYHQEVLDSLMAAIWQSGDGKSTASAFQATSTTELYTFIQMHGLDIQAQALLWQDDTPYDVMTIVNPRDGTEFVWYFDISAQMLRSKSTAGL